MQGVYLKFFMTELQKHNGELLYEWLLEQAKKMGVPGGSAFRAIAGYGRHRKIHEETFFELAGDVPIELSFYLNKAQAAQLLQLVKTEKLNLFYVKSQAEFCCNEE